MMWGRGLFAALIGLTLGGPAAANPLLAEVTALWEGGATELAGYTLTKPQESKGAAMFDCGKCENPFIAFIGADTMIEAYGTSDPDNVIEQMESSCDEIDCTLEEFTFDGLRAVSYSYTVLTTETVTTRYFLNDGTDIILVVLRPEDDIDGDFPLIRALEDSYLRPLIASRDP